MIYENDDFLVEFENSEIPWIKIFTKTPYKELSDAPDELRAKLFAVGLECERTLREFYKPKKINWASFANYVPKVHLHIQARFEDDSFFPESMWGKKQRDGAKRDLKLDEFSALLARNLARILEL